LSHRRALAALIATTSLSNLELQSTGVHHAQHHKHHKHVELQNQDEELPATEKKTLPREVRVAAHIPLQDRLSLYCKGVTSTAPMCLLAAVSHRLYGNHNGHSPRSLSLSVSSAAQKSSSQPRPTPLSTTRLLDHRDQNSNALLSACPWWDGGEERLFQKLPACGRQW
jgi:hypothetical protein